MGNNDIYHKHIFGEKVHKIKKIMVLIIISKVKVDLLKIKHLDFFYYMVTEGGQDRLIEIILNISDKTELYKI